MVNILIKAITWPNILINTGILLCASCLIHISRNQNIGLIFIKPIFFMLLFILVDVFAWHLPNSELHINVLIDVIQQCLCHLSHALRDTEESFSEVQS